MIYPSNFVHRRQLPAHRNFKDLTGERLGNFKVLQYAGYAQRGRQKIHHWIVLCDCGQRSVVNGAQARRMVSCRYCANKSTSRSNSVLVDGYPMKKHPAYNNWIQMRRRARDRQRYRKLGIHSAWLDTDGFRRFVEHIGPKPSRKHTVGRIDNEKGYYPGNVRWETPKQQLNNTSVNHLITFRGKTLTLTQWAEHLGMNKGTLQNRITNLGWSEERALTTPVQKRKKRRKGLLNSLFGS